MKRAWYLGCTEADIGQRVILVGDPSRVNRLANRLDNVTWLPESRGLRAVTGQYGGERVTAAAFGMGAPIAAIVAHELAYLGAKVLLRIGTAMALPPVCLGEYVIATDALRREGTSGAYTDQADEVVEADATVNTAVETALRRAALPYRKGRFASFDAFYRDMFSLEPEVALRIDQVRRQLISHNVLVADMETSAILTVARALGARAGSLCVATVDSVTRSKIDSTSMETCESRLFALALEAVTQSPLD